MTELQPRDGGSICHPADRWTNHGVEITLKRGYYWANPGRDLNFSKEVSYDD